MAGAEPLVQLGGGSGKARLLSWRSDLYISNGGRSLHVFSLERRAMAAVYWFPGNIWHMELDPRARQLFVLCARRGIYLLQWDEAGRLVMEAGGAAQSGPVAVYHIGPSFGCWLDPSVRAFSLAAEFLILAVQPPCKWQIKVLARSSRHYEEANALLCAEVEMPHRADTPLRPVLCCVSLWKGSKTDGTPSCFALEAPLFTRLFGVDSAFLESPIMLCGFPDGQVVYFPLKHSGYSHGDACPPKSHAKILYRLQEPVVSIGATKMVARDEQPIRSGAPSDCLLIIGQGGSLVSVTAAGDFQDGRVRGPVCCAAYLSSGVFYSTPCNLCCLTVSCGGEEAAPASPALSSVRHNIPGIAAAAQSAHPSEAPALLLLSSRGRLLLYKLNEEAVWRAGGGHTGQSMKGLLSGIGSVAERVSQLRSSLDEKSQSLVKLNGVMTLSRRLLTRRCALACDMKVSWTQMLQTNHMAVSCSLENSTDCFLEGGWTLCISILSDPVTSYSFPLKPLNPGERTELHFPLSLRRHTLDFPITISSILFYSLKALVPDSALCADTPRCSAGQQGICIPLQEHGIDLLQCIHLGPRTTRCADPPADAASAFIAALSEGEAHHGVQSLVTEGKEPLTARVRISVAILDQTLQAGKSGRSLCSAALRWLLPTEVMDPLRVTDPLQVTDPLEVRGLTPDGCDFTLRVQEVSASGLAAGGSFPAIEVQILGSHLPVVASLHSAVISRFKVLVRQSRAESGPPGLDLGKIRQQFGAYEPLLKELKILRDRLCLDEDLLSSAAAQRLLHIYGELRDPGLLFL